MEKKKLNLIIPNPHPHGIIPRRNSPISQAQGSLYFFILFYFIFLFYRFLFLN